MADSQFRTDHRHTVAHLQMKVGRGHQINAGAVHTRNIRTKVGAYFQLSKGLTVNFRLCHENAT